MALSRIEGVDGLYVGGIWALRRSESLAERRITHVLSLVSFNPASLRNFRDEPFSEYGKPFKHLLIDIDDVEDADLLVELPRAVRFIDEGLRGSKPPAAAAPPPAPPPAAPPAAPPHRTGDDDDDDDDASLHRGVDGLAMHGVEAERGGVFVHCAAGKSRSVSVIVAYLLWRSPNRFDPNAKSPSDSTAKRSRRDTAAAAVASALGLIRRTRPMAEPNGGFMEQLALWWEMSCPADVESQPAYQRWAHRREVQENLAVGQAPPRLRFEDEVARPSDASGGSGVSLRCKKCRRTLATAAFVLAHEASSSSSAAAAACQHVFIEPLSWMRAELEKGQLSGRLCCPGARCGASVGRYDWKGFRCSCGGWEIPAFSLQRARVDEQVARPAAKAGARSTMGMGIRIPPGLRGAGNL